MGTILRLLKRIAQRRAWLQLDLPPRAPVRCHPAGAPLTRPSAALRLTAALLTLLASPRAWALCGDGVHDADEACDDADRAPGDGCDARCQIEPGWRCTDATLSQSFVEVLHDEAEIRGGYHRPPSFVTASTGDVVDQLENAQAAIYGTSIPMSEVRLTMDMTVTERGDDFIGLTVGYVPGERAAEDADWLVLDWRRTDYRSSSCRGSAGLALSRVRGPLQGLEDLWCHTGAFDELARANTLGGVGWRPDQTYRVEVRYSRSRVEVFVDGVLEISVDGVFPDGELGLYAFSQEGARWSLVSPKDQSVCAGLDADQDGLSDAIEAHLGLDPQRADSDGDGVRDRREVGDLQNPLDTDLDGVFNALDTDDDGDGALTRFESWDGDRDPTNDDTDRDGLPDYLDGDDDGDGVPTLTERGGLTSPGGRDTDADGRPDMVDLDDDGDGVLTRAERGPSAQAPRDTDADGLPDSLDDDDDGDTIPTASESYDGDRDPSNDDSDRDGMPDYLDTDDDGDGVLTTTETAGSAGQRDQDFDGRPDHIDPTLNLPEGVTPPADETEVAPAPAVAEEAPPSAAEQVGAALDAGLAAVQEATTSTDEGGGGCGCGAGAGHGGLVAALAALAISRARRSAHGGRP